MTNNMEMKAVGSDHFLDAHFHTQRKDDVLMGCLDTLDILSFTLGKQGSYAVLYSLHKTAIARQFETNKEERV